MANRVTDCGVPQDTAADIRALPTITDIGVPTEGLIVDQQDPNGPTHQRLGTDLQTTNSWADNIGVPYDPITGITST